MSQIDQAASYRVKVMMGQIVLKILELIQIESYTESN